MLARAFSCTTSPCLPRLLCICPLIVLYLMTRASTTASSRFYAVFAELYQNGTRLFHFGSCLLGQLTVCLAAPPPRPSKTLPSFPCHAHDSEGRSTPQGAAPASPAARRAPRQQPAPGPRCSPLTSPAPHPGSPAPTALLPAPGHRRSHPPKLHIQGQTLRLQVKLALSRCLRPSPMQTTSQHHASPLQPRLGID